MGVIGAIEQSEGTINSAKAPNDDSLDDMAI